MYGQHSILCQHRQSMLGLRMMHDSFSARTALDFRPELFQQMAGLSLFYNTANFYYLYLSVHEQAGCCVQLMKRDSKKPRSSARPKLWGRDRLSCASMWTMKPCAPSSACMGRMVGRS